MTRTILILLGFLFSSGALAAGAVNAQVARVRVDQDGRAIVHFSQSIGSTPASCRHPAYFDAFAFDTNTAGGRSALAMLLTAKATGATVTAYGLGTCNVYGGAWVEDWNYGELGS